MYLYVLFVSEMNYIMHRKHVNTDLGGLAGCKTWFNPPFSSENACSKSGVWQHSANRSVHFAILSVLSTLHFGHFPWSSVFCYYFYCTSFCIHPFINVVYVGLKLAFTDQYWKKSQITENLMGLYWLYQKGVGIIWRSITQPKFVEPEQSSNLNCNSFR